MNRDILVFTVAILILQSVNIYSQNKETPIPSQQDLGEILTLEKCIDLALANNHSIKISEKKLAEARGKRQEAFGGFLPSLSVSASHTRLSDVASIDMPAMLLQPEGGIGSPVRFYGYETFSYKMGTEENYLGKLTLTQPLFTWGKIRIGNKYAILNYELTQEEYRKVKNEVVFNVKKSFYYVLLAQEFLKIAEEGVEVLEKHYQAIQGFYDEGKVSTVDVSRVNVQVVNAKTRKIKAINGLKLAKKGLFNLINQPENKNWQIQGKLEFKSQEVDLEKSFKVALENRPEVKQLDIREKIVGSFLKLARAENRPNLAFVANYQYQKPYYFENIWKDNWNATVAMTFPLFNGFSNWGKIKQAKAQIGQVEIGRDQLEKGLMLEVEKVYLDLEESRERIDAQMENVKAAKENLDAIQRRYEKGLVSDLDLRDTQLALTQAEIEYSQALFDYNVALAGLDKAIGK